MSDIVQINIKDLDLNLLRALDALHEERSVTRAADRLALTQSTVSGMLKRLRILFEDELFVRTSHGITPTPRADALIKPVQEILRATHALLAPQTFDPALEEIHVRLSGSDYIQNTLLGPLAGKILAEAPRARVTLLPLPQGPVDLPLLRGDIDIAFSTLTAAERAPDGLVLYQDTLVCISSYRRHVRGQHLDLGTLCDLSHVVLWPYGSVISQKIDALLEDRGLARNIVMRVPNIAAVFQALSHAELVAFLPRQMAARHGAQFKHLRVDLKTPTTQVVAQWHPGMTPDPRHMWVRSKLLETVDALTQQG